MVSGSHSRQHSRKSADLEMLREGGLLFLVSLEVQLLLIHLSGSSIAQASPQLTLLHWPNFSKKQHYTLSFEKTEPGFL